MKKKLFAVLLSTMMVLGLAACGNSKADFADSDLVFKGSKDIQVAKDYAIIVYDDVTYYTDHVSGNYDEYDEEYATSRGLKLGMTLSDYQDLYSIKNGYAVWELYTGSNNEYTSFDSYTNQTPADMYKEANNVWLDLGWCKEDGKWRIMTDVEVRDTWFCDADLDDYDEIVFFAVNFDSMGKIVGISLEHVTYDEDWVEWQGWL